VTYDFDDEEVNRLLGLDDRKEVALAVIEVPGRAGISLDREETIPPLSRAVLQARRVSTRETDYPAIREIHEAGNRRTTMPPHPALSLKPGEMDPLAKEMVGELGITPESWTSLETMSSWPEVIEYPDAVFRRRSRRNFIKKPMSREALSALLLSLCGNEGSPHGESVAVGFLVGQVEDMAPGFYLLDRKRQAWAMVCPGQFMAKSTSICLDQQWLVNAGVHFLFLANLERLEKAWGPRGYRYAMLAAGRLGQRIYVAAEAMGMGCCGIGALYDGEAMAMLKLNRGSRLLYLVAVGNTKGV
jgi:nitroreductase